jgi:hypothetical protein
MAEDTEECQEQGLITHAAKGAAQQFLRANGA